MSSFQTQSQRDLMLAATRVNELRAKSYAEIYGGLCHSFPVMVRTAGLAQALAFHQSKAGERQGDREQAHARLLADVAALLPGFDAGTASLQEYVRATRRILAAWVFYKRFAVSILKTEADSAKDS